MKLKGIIFDVDGTLADTENIHRQAFNQAFKDFDLSWHWSFTEYRKLLVTSGGQDRLEKYLNNDPQLKNKIDDPKSFIKRLHQRKSVNYRTLLKNSNIALRPGVEQLIREAQDGNIKLAIATCSSTDNLKTLLNLTLAIEPEEIFSVIVSSDVVVDKKPSPIVYQFALASLGLDAGNCIAIEDTSNGNLAALRAGLKTVITTHQYTVDDNFNGASIVIDNLGEIDKAMVISEDYPTHQQSYIKLLNELLTQHQAITDYRLLSPALAS